jgi:hypothetical protein
MVKLGTGTWAAGGWEAAGISARDLAAHEAGHLMGLYPGGKPHEPYQTVDGKPVPRAGYEGQIMAGVPGGRATKEDIEAIIAANSPWGRFVTFLRTVLGSGGLCATDESASEAKAGYATFLSLLLKVQAKASSLATGLIHTVWCL